MTDILDGLTQILKGLLQIVTAPLRIVAGPFGCLFSGLFSFLFLVGGLFLVFYLVGLQHVGPRIDGNILVVNGSDGVQRRHELTPDSAAFFDIQVTAAEGRGTSESLELVIDEREINSKLTALLTAEREADAGFPVNSLILVLKPDQATFFINGRSIGRTVGVEVRVKFEIDSDRRIDLAVDRVKLGGLPGIPFSKQLADLVFESTALDDEFERALPAGVRDVSIEEGRIVILLDTTR